MNESDNTTKYHLTEVDYQAFQKRISDLEEMLVQEKLEQKSLKDMLHIAMCQRYKNYVPVRLHVQHIYNAKHNNEMYLSEDDMVRISLRQNLCEEFNKILDDYIIKRHDGTDIVAYVDMIALIRKDENPFEALNPTQKEARSS